ncbi:unnamed protein product [Rotaria socialis]|uniref:Uncharacterized protein n=2 Tax=Rotaria socialis TaxID=392032 RepID=A0A818T140_9BILA|nr:unnamed protein product [Rotaria socialis]
MDRVVTKTVDALTRFGERIERRLSTGEDDDNNFGLERSGSGHMFSSSGSEFRRPSGENYNYSSKNRDLAYGRAGKNSKDNLAAMPSPYNNFNNYRQNSMANQYVDQMDTSPYGTGIGGPMNYGYSGQSSGVPYGAASGNVGYAPDYYIAERRQVELVPAPPPRYIRQPVPVPVPVDRPVPQPYPVRVPVSVPVDRPVPYPVPVAVPSPPVQVPVPVPTPVPCYVPVAVPVPSPPPSPVMVENSVTYTQRWVDSSPAIMNQQSYRAGSPVMMNQQSYRVGSPVMMNQQSYRAGSPVMMRQQSYRAGSPVMMNQQDYRAGSPVMMNQQNYRAGSPFMMNQQRYMAGSPAMGMNPCAAYGNGSFIR